MQKEDLVKKIKQVCQSSILFKRKTVFSLNEILYILLNWKAELGIPDLFAITVGEYCIPSLDAFVPTKIRAIKFNINDVEYEEEEFASEEFPLGTKTACLVIHKK